MNTPDQGSTNYLRRALGVVVCLSPVALTLASIVDGLAIDSRPRFAALGFMLAALCLAIFNFHHSFVRPLLLRRRHGSLEGLSHISGVPIAGTLLVAIGCVVGFGAVGSGMVGLVALALDTGGLPWFLIATWRDSSLWDAAR